MRVVHAYDVKYEVANGIYKTVAGLMTGLPKHGVQVEAWNLTPQVDTVIYRQVNGANVIDLPSYSREWSVLCGLPAATRAFIEARQREVDLVHFHSVLIPNNIWVARMLKVPYVVTPNGGYSQGMLDGSNQWIKHAWMAWHERKYLQRAKAVLAVSDMERDELAARWPDLTLRCTVNGIDVPAQVVEQTRASRDFVFLGRLAIDHKGLDRMIRGFAKFVAGHAASDDEAPRLVLAGPDWRGSRTVLEKLTQDEGIAEQVSFLGPVFGPEKQKLLAKARAFVHTSRWEGLPFSVLEAMSLGTPVMVTPETHVGEYVKRYNAGIEVAGDVPSIAAGFERMSIASLPERQELGRGARQVIEENFTWPVAIGQVLAAYQQVLAPAGAQAPNGAGAANDARKRSPAMSKIGVQ